MFHIKCRNNVYYDKINKKIVRFHVPDDKVDWNSSYPIYNPTQFISTIVIGQPWADQDSTVIEFH